MKLSSVCALLSSTACIVSAMPLASASAALSERTTTFNIAVRAPSPQHNPDEFGDKVEARAESAKDYLVVFRDSVGTPDDVVKGLLSSLKALGAKINYEYNTVIKGFAISIDPKLADAVKKLSTERWPFILEEDQVVKAAS